jgi:hypothetical protein
MQKRGQVTLFVVVGIVIVAVILTAVFFRQEIANSFQASELGEREGLSQEERNVADFIDGCLEETLVNGIFIITRNGGMYPRIENSIKYENQDIAVYDKVPTKEDIIQSLERYVDVNVMDCVGSMGDNPNTNIILEDSTRAEMSMDVKLTESKLNKFFAEVYVDLDNVLENVNEFYNIVNKYNSSIPILELSSYMEDKEFQYKYIAQENHTLHFLIWENLFEEEVLVWPFALEVRKESDLPAEITSLFVEEEVESENNLTLEDLSQEDIQLLFGEENV